MNKKIAAEFLFWMHLVLFIVWYALFFVPTSIWPARPAFHFWYIFVQVASELVTGWILMPKMKKFRIVCPLTTIMQNLRGYKFSDPKNFDHSFVREFARRIGVKLPYGLVGALIFASLALVSVQYYLYLTG